MRVVVVEPNKDPEVREIDGSLKSMQKIVDGYIETVMVAGRNEILLVCNEEGMIRGLKYNRGFYGAYFYVSFEGEEFRGLNDEQIKYILRSFVK